MNARELVELVDLTAPPAWTTDRRLASYRNTFDLWREFRRRVPRAVGDFIDGAAEDEVTLQRNIAAFAALNLVPRQFAGVAEIDPSTEIVSSPSPLPVVLAPVAAARLVHPDGEVAVAQAAARAGLIYTAPAMGTVTLEDIAAAGGGATQWFQLYIWRDRDLTRDLVARARRAGYRALVVTVDAPVPGARERDLTNGMNIPPKMTRAAAIDAARHPAWWLRALRSTPPALENVRHSTPSATNTSVMQYAAGQFNPAATWDDLPDLLSGWSGPVIIKGVLSVDDANRAVDAGATAIVVSNHGGRQLDRAPATINLLPEIVAAVGGRAEVLLDSGVRRGADIVAALSLGAKACLVGRPYIWGLAAGGSAGVSRAIAIFDAELRRTMALLGAPTLADLDPTLIGGHQLQGAQ